MTGETPFERFIAERGNLHWRERALAVVRNLKAEFGSDAINGIEGFSVGSDSLGIGVNRQRARWLLFAGVLISIPTLLMIFRVVIPMLGQTSSGEKLAVFGPAAILITLTGVAFSSYAIPPGPALVLVADSFGAYVLSRARGGFGARERVLDWREHSLEVRLNTVRTRYTTHHFVELLKVPRSRGLRRQIARVKVDLKVFEYWQSFYRRGNVENISLSVPVDPGLITGLVR